MIGWARPSTFLEGTSHERARDLEGLSALVTGATSGIGKAAAEELARHGAEVIVHGRDTTRGQAMVNERVHADLSDEDLGDERPVLGATDGPFFQGPQGERFASPMSLVGSMSFPFYLAAMRRPDIGRDPRFLTPELRQRNLVALHAIVQDWIRTFADLESLDAQMDEAKIATGQVRTVREFADSDWARAWNAVRAVPDRSGGEIRIPGRPWHFRDTITSGDQQVPAMQGEHNDEVLAELGFSPAEITKLRESGALIEG